MKKCPKCHTENAQVNKFCYNCGKDLRGVTSLNCSFCNSYIDVTAKFCPACGEVVKRNGSTEN